MSGLPSPAAVHLAASSPFHSETEESIRPSTRGQIETLDNAGSSSCKGPPTQVDPSIFVDGSGSDQLSGPPIFSHGQLQVDDTSISSTPGNANFEMSGGIITDDQDLDLDPDDPLVSQQPAQPDQIDPISGGSTMPANLDDDLDEGILDSVSRKLLGFPQLLYLSSVDFTPALALTGATFLLLLFWGGYPKSATVLQLEFLIFETFAAIILSVGEEMIWVGMDSHNFDFGQSIALATVFVICCFTPFIYARSDTFSTAILLFAPQASKSCFTRVSMQQSQLFTPGIYHTQFPLRDANETADNFLQRIQSIQTNSTLCSMGFTGNSDLYGLGIRTGLYFQWISSFLANNFLRSDHVILQSAYLICLIAIFVVTYFLSFSEDCIFSIEIEILYWIYWGGYVCVFLSAPNPIKLGSKPTWTGITWNTMIILTLHTFMICHAVWFWAWAYDYKFPRMPCGTYHFIPFPMLDPSTIFWRSRREFTLLILFPVLIQLMLASFMSPLLFAFEIKQTIQHSMAYKAISVLIPRRSQAQDPENIRAFQNAVLPLSRLCQILKALYQKFRKIYGLPGEVIPGIRLVTPVDIKQRR